MTSNESRKPGRLGGLQALRGLAVLLVIWTHLKFAGNFSAVPWIQCHAGAAGVDIFFVISGFVICASAESLGFDAGRFFADRFTRIAPLYWLTTLPSLLSLLKNGEAATPGSLVNSFLFLPIADFGGMSPSINKMGWSLSFEFWFYTLFSLSLLAVRQNAWKAVLAVLMAASLLIGLTYGGNYFFPRFVSNPLALEFGAGILIYQFKHRITAVTAGLALLGIVALVAFGLLDPGFTFGDFIGNYFSGLKRAATWGVVGVCLVIIVVHADQAGLVRWPMPLLRMGDFSYSLYLIQPYGLWIATKLVSKTSLPAWATGLSFVLSTLVLGASLSILVEGRLTKWTRRTFRRFGTNDPAPIDARAMSVVEPGPGVLERALP